MIRISIKLTSTTSPWFREAVKILKDDSKIHTPEYRLMSKISQPGKMNTVGVSEDDERSIVAWANSLGHAPSLDIAKTIISESVFCPEYQCPCGATMKALSPSAAEGCAWECQAGHGFRTVQMGMTRTAFCHMNPPAGLRIGNRVMWEIRGPQNPIIGKTY